MKKLKFSTEDSKFGLTEATGFLWSTKKGIHVEYQVKDTIIEAYKTEVTEVLIPYSVIQDVEYKSAWFSGGDIEVSLNTLKGYSDLPFLEETELVFSLDSRKHKNSAKEFVVNAKLENVHSTLDDLESQEFDHLG